MRNHGLIALVLFVAACAATVPKSATPALLAIGGDQRRCLQTRASGAWTLTGEHDIEEVLRALQPRTCVTYLVPQALAHRRVRLPAIGDSSAYALAAAIDGVLRDHGIDLLEDKTFRLVETPPVGRADETRGIHCTGTSCIVPRATLDKILGDTVGIMRSMKMYPHYDQNDEPSVVIGQFGPDSYAARLGFENADHVKTIAGVRIDIVDPNRDLR